MFKMVGKIKHAPQMVVKNGDEYHDRIRNKSPKKQKPVLFTASMYGIFTYIWLIILMVFITR